LTSNVQLECACTDLIIINNKGFRVNYIPIKIGHLENIPLPPHRA